MSSANLLVLLVGTALIVWVNWYFFLARPSAVATAASGSFSQVRITVDGGYSPATVRVPAGRPVRLVFDRRDTSSCSEEVVFPDFGVRQYLPTGKQTSIELTPPKPGRYEFMCGMSMLHGTVIAEPSASISDSAR